MQTAFRDSQPQRRNTAPAPALVQALWQAVYLCSILNVSSKQRVGVLVIQTGVKEGSTAQAPHRVCPGARPRGRPGARPGGRPGDVSGE